MLKGGKARNLRRNTTLLLFWRKKWDKLNQFAHI